MSQKMTKAQLAEWQAGLGKKQKGGSQKPKTDYKAIFLANLKYSGIPDPVQEFLFHPKRKWRLDFAWPDQKIAVEYHGIFGAHKAGHQAVKSLQRDYEKANEAILLGWTYLVITAETVNNNKGLEWLEKALKGKNDSSK